MDFKLIDREGLGIVWSWLSSMGLSQWIMRFSLERNKIVREEKFRLHWDLCENSSLGSPPVSNQEEWGMWNKGLIGWC